MFPTPNNRISILLFPLYTYRLHFKGKGFPDCHIPWIFKHFTHAHCAFSCHVLADVLVKLCWVLSRDSASSLIYKFPVHWHRRWKVVERMFIRIFQSELHWTDSLHFLWPFKLNNTRLGVVWKISYLHNLRVSFFIRYKLNIHFFSFSLWIINEFLKAKWSGFYIVRL